MHFLHLISALPFVPAALAWTSYTVPYSGGGDDTPALISALNSRPELRTDATIVFQEGVTYNLETPVNFPYFKNIIIEIQGNITFANDVEKTEAIIASNSYDQAWICFSQGGANVTLLGSADPNQGWIVNDGQKWWDAIHTSGMMQYRPRTLGFYVIEGGEIGYLKLSQPVAWTISTGGSNNIHVHDNTISAVSNNEAWPYNTDGFAVGGTNQLLENNHITNGDDCVIVNGPADNIVVRNTDCNGGASFSVAAAGQYADIKNILFEDCTASNVYLGASVRAPIGGTGAITNVVFRNIVMNNANFPIYVTHRYFDVQLGETASSQRSGTFYNGIKFEGFTGTVNDAARFREGNCTAEQNNCPWSEPGATGKEVVYISVTPGETQGILLKDIHITTNSGATPMAMCDPSQVYYDPGFDCCDCAFQPTSAGISKRFHHLHGLQKARRSGFSYA